MTDQPVPTPEWHEYDSHPAYTELRERKRQMQATSDEDAVKVVADGLCRYMGCHDRGYGRRLNSTETGWEPEDVAAFVVAALRRAGLLK